MAKTKTIKSTVLATNAAPEMVHTVHGETLAASELTHIHPDMHRFAIRLDALTRDPDNARKHGERDLPSTANSLKRVGQIQPITFWVDGGTKLIISGNGRHEAASNILGWKYIAAVRFRGTRAQAKIFAAADNRTAELSAWDPENFSKLLDEINDLEALGPELADFTLEEIGLGADDLAELEEAFEEKQKKKSTAVETKQSESVPGKFFNIVIKCGSEKHQVELLEALTAGKPKDLIKLLNGADIRTQN